MNFKSRYIGFSAALLIASTTALTSPAFAFDATAYIAKYTKLVDESGYTIKHRSVESVGENGFALLDVSFNLKSNISSQPLKFDRMEITGIKEDVGGGFAAEGFVLEGMLYENETAKDESVVIKMDRASGEGIYFPDPNDVDAPLSYFDKGAFKSSPIDLLVAGKKIMSIGSVTGNTDMVSGKLAGVSSMRADNIFFDLTAIDDPGFTLQREAIGYDKINMAVNLAADFDMEKGDLNINQYSISGDEVGKFNTALSLGGYTVETAKKLKQWGIDNEDKSEAELQAAFITLLPLLGDVVVKSALIEFDDDSITSRVLKYQAAKMGKKPEEISAMVPTMAMIGLSQLGNPEFAGAVAAALGQYILEPGNLKIQVAPEKPVSIPEIVAVSATDPRKLIETLNVQVTANK